MANFQVFWYEKCQQTERGQPITSHVFCVFWPMCATWCRGGTSPIFSSPSRARASKIEPVRASSLGKLVIEPATSLEHCSLGLKSQIFTFEPSYCQHRAWPKLKIRLGRASKLLGSIEPELGAYLLKIQFQARAHEPEPRLVPPLRDWLQGCSRSVQKNVTVMVEILVPVQFPFSLKFCSRSNELEKHGHTMPFKELLDCFSSKFKLIQP